MLIIFSGYNQRAVVAFLRQLKKLGISDYAIMASGENDRILISEYSSKVAYIRRHKELNKGEIYAALDRLQDAGSSKKNIIVPSTEALNRFLVANRQEIEAHGTAIPLVEDPLYSMISDKRSFYHMCRHHGLRVPRLIELPEEYTQPYVAKPVKYISDFGERLVPVIVDSPDKHRQFYENYHISDFDIQEFVDGESFYLLFYLSRRSGVNYKFSQQNCAQQPNGGSIIAALGSDIHKMDITNRYVSMLRGAGFYGFIMIELRRWDGEYYMIEANPRMWGPSQLYVDADVPLIDAFLYDHGIIDSIPGEHDYPMSFYHWSGGLKDPILEDRNCVWLHSGRELVQQYYDKFIAAEIYDREDTRKIYEVEKEEWR